jgi:hypothetical protein
MIVDDDESEVDSTIKSFTDIQSALLHVWNKVLATNLSYPAPNDQDGKINKTKIGRLLLVEQHCRLVGCEQYPRCIYTAPVGMNGPGLSKKSHYQLFAEK